MWSKVRHPSDGELLVLQEEDALSARRRSRLRAHLARCRRCARRQAELVRLSGAAERAGRERPAGMTPGHIARARLRAAMEARAARVPEPGWAAFAVGGAAVLVLVLLSGSAFDPGPAQPSGSLTVADRAQGAPGLLLPRPDLTPGTVRPVGVGEVCGGALPGLPAVPSQVPRQVFEAYGVDYRQAADYELDFLITPELGGASDPGNLWPQPYRSVVWNAYVKDELELHLQRLVCQGALDLATAQRELAADWIAAYKRRFNTERPLRDYSRFPLTASDVDALRAEKNEERLLPALRRS
jgi:hypothetical protein